MKNSMIKTAWRCRLGHVWYAPYNAIDKGSNCAVCVRRVRRLDSAYHALAAQHGFTWLGPDVAEPDHLTNWICVHGHHWAASYIELQTQPHCPACQLDKSTKVV